LSEDGRISESWSVSDAVGLTQQLGALQLVSISADQVFADWLTG
jgi:hypothetical protein